MALNPRIEDWHGKTAWLVGASTGIGRATASALHAAGAHVVVSARSREGLDRFVAEHPGSTAIALDATDAAAMHGAAQRIVGARGGIDLAMYCAGTYTAMRATAFDLEVALRHVQVNYVGALYMLDAVLPVLLRQQGGHVSLVSSVTGYRGLPKALAYGPTKAALINLAESMYFDLTDHGIGVSIICPGFVDTPLGDQVDHARPGLITAEAAAAAIMDGWRKGRFHMHFPKRFTAWISAARHLGDGLYFGAIRRVTGL